MATSITRWNMTSFTPMGSAQFENLNSNALQPYIDSGATNGIRTTIIGPDGGVPDGQYEIHRTWTTTEGAQVWLDQIDGIAAGAGCVCLEKRLVP